jgi:hypothetical protein
MAGSNLPAPHRLVLHRRALLLVCGVLLAACQRTPTPEAAPAASKPAQAVRMLSRHLRDNDLQAFAHDAVPPALHTQLEAAWRDGRTRWPLDELPFDDRLPAMLRTLSAPGAESSLQRVFDKQFAGARTQIAGAAASLGVFGAQYIQQQGNYTAEERQHYAQLIQATSRWGMTAPLGDRTRAHAAIVELARAARRTGLASEADFRAAGLDDSLRRMGPLAAAFKQVLARYGLDLDASLDGMQVTLQQQTGDTARVRMRYRVGSQDIDTVVSVRRIDGRWYLDDYLRHAQAAVSGKPPSPNDATHH